MENRRGVLAMAAHAHQPPTPLPRRPLVATEAERLSKAWTSDVLDRASLDEIERMPMDGVLHKLPALVARLLHATVGTGPALADAESATMALLVGLRGREDPSLAEVAGELARLEGILLAALRDSGELAALEGLPGALAPVHAAAAEEVLRRRTRALERLATTDALTGLRNRRHLLEQLEHLYEMSERYGQPYAVVAFDVVGLKAINDSSGHPAGDRALIDVARATERTVRGVDVVVRVSGDEFCVLVPNQGADAAVSLARRLVAAVGALEGPGGSPVAVSVGVAACPEHGCRGHELLARADAAMYRARAIGDRVGLA